jgi:hypothetical protein
MELDRATRSTAIETHTEALFGDQALYNSRVELYHALMTHTDANVSVVHRKLEILMGTPMKTQTSDTHTPRIDKAEQGEQKNTVVQLRRARRMPSHRRKPHASVVSLR